MRISDWSSDVCSSDLFAADVVAAVAADGELLVGADRGAGVLLHARLQVLLRVHEDLLAAGLVLEAQFVEAAAALGRVALERRLRGLARRVGWHVVGVVEAADDVGPVGVAVFERHQHLLADARRNEAAPLGAGVALGDAPPARTLVVVRALSVPVVLHLPPSVVVDFDLIALRSGHDRGMPAGPVRPWRTPGPAISPAAGDAGESE